MGDFSDVVPTYQVHCRKKTDLVENVQLKERRRLCVHVCVSVEWLDDLSLQDYLCEMYEDYRPAIVGSWAGLMTHYATSGVQRDNS